MLKELRLLVGINIFWLALSMLFDGINTLVLPLRLGQLVEPSIQATTLGLLTFVGLMGGALIQPVAGTLSDRWRHRLGRNGFIGIGLLLSLISLFFFAIIQNLVGITITYLAIQLTASFAQAGQQGLIPDLVDDKQRGIASGLKGFMDITGAMFGFILLGLLLGSGSPSLAIGAVALTLVIAYLLAIWVTPRDRPINRVGVKNNVTPIRHTFLLDFHEYAGFVRLLIARFLFLLGIYSTGRFLLLFVADRLNLPANQAAEQAGTLLAGLALITILASPLTGWLADRIGRLTLMVAGAALGALSAILLIWANQPIQLLLFGGFMSLGSAAFASGSWALLADWVPKDAAARFFGLANFSTAGAAAVAGLFGPLIDWVERLFPGQGFSILFLLACLAFIASVLPVKDMFLKEVYHVRNKRKVRAHDSGLAVVSISTDPALLEEDQNSSGRTTSP
jgi:MFS family permease